MVALFLLLALLQATPRRPLRRRHQRTRTRRLRQGATSPAVELPPPRYSSSSPTRSGRPIEGVTVNLMGPVDREVKSPASGPTRIEGLRAGTYRARFSRDGFITFEKEISWRAGTAAPELSITLNPAPAAPASATAAARPGEARTVDVEAAAAGHAEDPVAARLHREELHLRARAAKRKSDRMLRRRPDDAVADSRPVERTRACVRRRDDLRRGRRGHAQARRARRPDHQRQLRRGPARNHVRLHQARQKSVDRAGGSVRGALREPKL